MLYVSFQVSCKLGYFGIVELLLKEDNYQEIIDSKNQLGENGFMTACKMGQYRITELLLKHPSISGIINEKDNKGNTGYMKACLVPSIEVMNLIHDHKSDPIERNDAYAIFKQLCKKYS